MLKSSFAASVRGDFALVTRLKTILTAFANPHQRAASINLNQERANETLPRISQEEMGTGTSGRHVDDEETEADMKSSYFLLSV